jgi:MFS family permease
LAKGAPVSVLIEQLSRRVPRLLTTSAFRWLWLATAISSLGNWFGFVALNIYVYDLTGSATAIAGLMAFQAVPALVISPVAGVVVDRLPRRTVMITAQLLAGLIWALIPLTASLWQIYLLALAARVTTSFYLPAERSLVPDLVGKEHVLNANAALSVISTSSFVLGPALAGLLIAATSAGMALWLNAASFMAAALCIARIQVALPRVPAAAAGKPGWWAEALAGLHYAARQPALRVLAITTFVSTFAGAGLLTVELVYVKDVLGGGDRGYGLYYSVAGIGALVASSSAAYLVRRYTLAGTYVGSVLSTGLLFFPYANVPILWFVIVTTGFHAIPWVLGMVLVDTMLQQWADDTVRGRVFALLQAQRSAGQVLVAAILAPLVDLWGPVPIMNISGVIYTLVGLYAVLRVGVLRRAEAEGLHPPRDTS